MPFGTLWRSSHIRELKRTANFACLTIAVMALTGCGLLPFGDTNNTQNSAPRPPVSTDNAAQPAVTAADPAADTMTESGTASMVPDGYTQVPAPIPAALTPPIDPVIAAGPLQLGEDGPMGALGINLEEYFDDNADIDTRVSRVERAVTAIQKDLRTLAPPIKRLITVERDIQALVAQLADFVEAPPPPEPAPAPVQMAPMPSAAPMPTMNAQQKSHMISGGKTIAGSSGVTVGRLRTGEHPDKSRIVLDASGPTTYRYDLDNEEMLLVIELPQAGWTGKMQETIRKSPVIAGYSVHPFNGGSRVIVQLKKRTSIAYEIAIRPNGNKNYRIVIDLKK